MGRSPLRPDLHRAQIALDNMPRLAWVRDKYGDLWQQDWHRIYWHGGYDEVLSSFHLAQSAPIERAEGTAS